MAASWQAASIVLVCGWQDAIMVQAGGRLAVGGGWDVLIKVLLAYKVRRTFVFFNGAMQKNEAYG